MPNNKAVAENKIVKKDKIQKSLIGKSLRDSKDKTVKVLVENILVHPIYRKKIASSRKMLVHTEIEVKKDQKVEINETKPTSKSKTWKIKRIVE